MHFTRRKKTIIYYKKCCVLMIDTIYILYSLYNIYEYDKKKKTHWIGIYGNFKRAKQEK